MDSRIGQSSTASSIAAQDYVENRIAAFGFAGYAVWLALAIAASCTTGCTPWWSCREVNVHNDGPPAQCWVAKRCPDAPDVPVRWVPCPVKP